MPAQSSMDFLTQALAFGKRTEDNRDRGADVWVEKKDYFSPVAEEGFFSALGLASAEAGAQGSFAGAFSFFFPSSWGPDFLA